MFRRALVLLAGLVISQAAEKTERALVISGGRATFRPSSTDLNQQGAYDMKEPVRLEGITTASIPVSIAARGIPYLHVDEATAEDPCGTPTNAVLRKVVTNTQPATFVVHLCLPKDKLAPARGDIQITAEGSDPFSFSVTVEPEEGTGILKMVLPVIPVVTGILLGLGSGIVSFLFQQRQLRKTDQERKFAENKIANSLELWKFFRDEYRPLLAAETPKSMRETLIRKKIYGILPLSEIQELNRICDAKSPDLEKLKKLLEKNFPEFI